MTVGELKLKMDALDDELDVRIATDVWKHFLACGVELRTSPSSDDTYILIF